MVQEEGSRLSDRYLEQKARSREPSPYERKLAGAIEKFATCTATAAARAHADVTRWVDEDVLGYGEAYTEELARRSTYDFG